MEELFKRSHGYLLATAWSMRTDGVQLSGKVLHPRGKRCTAHNRSAKMDSVATGEASFTSRLRRTKLQTF